MDKTVGTLNQGTIFLCFQPPSTISMLSMLFRGQNKVGQIADPRKQHFAISCFKHARSLLKLPNDSVGSWLIYLNKGLLFQPWVRSKDFLKCWFAQPQYSYLY